MAWHGFRSCWLPRQGHFIIRAVIRKSRIACWWAILARFNIVSNIIFSPLLRVCLHGKTLSYNLDDGKAIFVFSRLYIYRRICAPMNPPIKLWGARNEDDEVAQAVAVARHSIEATNNKIGSSVSIEIRLPIFVRWKIVVIVALLRIFGPAYCYRFVDMLSNRKQFVVW